MATVSASWNCSMVTFVDCGDMHDKETRRLSVIPIISSGRVLILMVDSVRPGRGRMRRERGYASERPVKHRPHARVLWGFEQPKKTVSGSSTFCRSKSIPKVSAYRGGKQTISYHSRSQTDGPLSEQGRVRSPPSAGSCRAIRIQMDEVAGSPVRAVRISYPDCW